MKRKTSLNPFGGGEENEGKLASVEWGKEGARKKESKGNGVSGENMRCEIPTQTVGYRLRLK